METVVADTRIGSSEFGDYQYARFVLWAFLVRQSKGAFLRNIAVARTEANQGTIAESLAYYCQVYGLEEEELLRRVLAADADGKSSVSLHQELEEESRDRGDHSLLPKRSEKKKKRSPRRQDD